MKLKRYHLIQLPFWAFFSKRLYRDVGLHWRGGNFAYLFLLLALCCIPAALELHDAALEQTAAVRREWLHQLPPLEIRDGRVRIEQHQPLYLSDRQGTPKVIIDTTGSMNYIAEPSVNLLLTESELIVRTGARQFSTIDLSGVEALTVTDPMVAAWLDRVDRALLPLTFGLLLFTAYVATAGAVLALAFFGRILSALAHFGLRIGQVVRITTVAATPALLVLTLAYLLRFNVPLTVCGVVTLLYLLAGLLACKGGNEEAVDLKAFLDRDASMEKAA